MAFSGNTIWDIRTGGSDTANGGAFDPSQTGGMFTDGAATSATGSSPVFSSASYNFVAGDVGAWVYIASGTNWTPGWYQIASVASNQATLSAAIGAAIQTTMGSTNTKYPDHASTVAGCATTASPTGATWSIDYSQQTSPQFTYIDIASTGAGLTVSSAAHPFAAQQVGNCIVVTAGTNFTTGRYIIASVAAGVATVVGAANITTGVGSSGTGSLGGCLKTPGQAGATSGIVTNNVIFLQSGTIYSITTASNNVASGTINNTFNCVWVGWATNRHTQNTDAAPIIQYAASAVTMFNDRSQHYNLIIDGNSQTTANGGAGGFYDACTIKNMTAASTIESTTRCAFTGNTATQSSTTADGCEAWANTATPFTGQASNCLSYGNTGASTDGFQVPASGNTIVTNCTAYNNGRDGFRFSSNGRGQGVINCHSEANTGFGYNPNGSTVTIIGSSDYNNGSGRVNFTAGVPTQQTGSITLTGSAFVNAAGNNLALNNTAGAGAAIRGIAGAFPRGTTTGYADVGAVQHQDSGGGSSGGFVFGG